MEKSIFLVILLITLLCLIKIRHYENTKKSIVVFIEWLRNVDKNEKQDAVIV